MAVRTEGEPSKSACGVLGPRAVVAASGPDFVNPHMSDTEPGPQPGAWIVAEPLREGEVVDLEIRCEIVIDLVTAVGIRE